MAVTAKRFIRPGSYMSRSKRKLKRMPVYKPVGPGVGVAPIWFYSTKNPADKKRPVIYGHAKPVYAARWVQITGIFDSAKNETIGILYDGNHKVGEVGIIEFSEDEHGNPRVLARLR